MKAPETKKIIYIHSDDFDSRKDPYHWLATRNENIIDSTINASKDIREYIKAENEYAEAKFFDFKSQQIKIEQDLSKFSSYEDDSFEFQIGSFHYYYHYSENKEFPTLYRYSDEHKKKIPVFDIQKLANNKPNFKIGDIKISTNGKYIAYAIDTTGKNRYNISILDIQKSLTQKTKITNSDGQVFWGPNNKSIFYVGSELIENKRTPCVLRYNFLDNGNKKKLVFKSESSSAKIELDKSKSGKYLFIYTVEGQGNQSLFLDLINNSGVQEFSEREKGIKHFLEHQGLYFIVKTNKDNSNNFKLYKTIISEFSKPEKWINLIGHQNDMMIQNIDVFEKFIVLEEKIDGLVKFHILNSETGLGHYADFPEETYSAKLNYNFDYFANEFIYEYSSLSTPPTLFSYIIDSRKTKIKERSGLDRLIKEDHYKTERVWATSFDGTRIPISVVYNKKTKLNGKAPLLITCEGVYGKTKEMRFNPELMSLLDNGFVYAIAHVRGGGYLGEMWHLAGTGEKKKNAILDFISCIDDLNNQEYTSAEHIFAYGKNSNAAIIAAAINFNSQLFKGVALESPRADLLTSLLNAEQNDLTDNSEWGDPQKEELYYYLKSYSPYDNIREQKNPEILIINYLNNSTPYWEGLKWGVKMRTNNLADSKTIIYTDTKLHAGRNNNKALIYSFFMAHANN